MGAREWSKSFLSSSPSVPSSPVSNDGPASDAEDHALQRSSHLNRQLDLSARDDRAVVPDANPFSISKKRSAAQKSTAKSAQGSNIRPAGNVRPASARKAQPSVPEDVQRRKGWSNGRGEAIPPVAKSKRKAVDDGSCTQIDGNRLSRDAELPLKSSKPPTPSSKPAKKKAAKKKSADVPAKDTAESREFPIIAGLTRQRSLPTKAEKPEPDINLIVSGYGARVERKPASRYQGKTSTSSRSSAAGPSLRKWLSAAAITGPSLEEKQRASSSSPPLDLDDGLEPPATPPAPPLEHTSGAATEYASSAVTTLKTPSTVRRAEVPVREPTPQPTHAQLLEDMVEQMPHGYSLYEQDDGKEEHEQPQRELSSEAQHDQRQVAPSRTSNGTPASTTASRLSQFRFQGQKASAAAASSPNNQAKHLPNHLSRHLQNSTPAPASPLPPPARTPQRANTPAPSFAPRPAPAHASTSRLRPTFATPQSALSLNLTPKFSSPAQVIRPRPQPFQSSRSYTQPSQSYAQPSYSQPRPQSRGGVQHGGVVAAGHSYVGLYQPPKPPTPAAGPGKRRLTLPPTRTSYTSGSKVTTWEPTALAQSRAVAAQRPPPGPAYGSAYVPRHLRALQQASQVQEPARAPTASSSEEDWEQDWRPSANRAA